MDAFKVDHWLGRLGRLLLAPRCQVCREPGTQGRDLCAACAAQLPWLGHACLRCALPLHAPGTCGQCLHRPPPLDQTHATFVYGFPLDRLLPRFKFHDDLAAGRLLSLLMLERVQDLPRPAALVPVPLHRQRLRSRGYDQALELARPLARALDLPLLAQALVRQRPTQAQSELDAGRRWANVQGAFCIAPGARPPAHVVLVDDVMTTGATLHAAARCLRQAGVERVDAWVCARVP